MVLAFCVLLAPLLIATMVVAGYLGHITVENQHAVVRAASIVRHSQSLLQQLGDLERAAGVYEIVGGENFRDAYQQSRQHFRNAVEALQADAPGQQARAKLAQLRSAEEALSGEILWQSPSAGNVQALMNQFDALRVSAQGVLSRSSRQIDAELGHMQQRSTNALHVLWLAVAAALPVAGLLCALVILSIIRPLRDVENEIRELGKGEFGNAIAIRGPQDIEQLGRGLEWLRTRLQALEAQKRSFLQNVSHELKTPLTSVREGTGLLDNVGPVNVEQREIIGIIADNALQLQHRIEALLDFSAAQAQRMILHRTRVDLERLVGETVKSNRLICQPRDIRIEMELTSVELDADAVKIRTVLDNLVSNAVRYSPQHGRVRVGVRVAGDEALVDVQDQGPGIAPRHRAHLFEPFYRGDAPPPDNGGVEDGVKGSGLGLSVAHAYVTAHNGNIEIVKNDDGAHFRVHLPIHAA